MTDGLLINEAVSKTLFLLFQNKTCLDVQFQFHGEGRDFTTGANRGHCHRYGVCRYSGVASSCTTHYMYLLLHLFHELSIHFISPSVELFWNIKFSLFPSHKAFSFVVVMHAIMTES